MAFGHRSFLVLGGGAADILSLIKGGLEILNYDFSFEQGVDQRGKATTKVYGGTIDIALSQLPPQEIIKWGIRSREYKSGVIILLDANNMPIERIIFKNGACVNFEINYTESGKSYSVTRISIIVEELIVGDGVTFDNEWIS